MSFSPHLWLPLLLLRTTYSSVSASFRFPSELHPDWTHPAVTRTRRQNRNNNNNSFGYVFFFLFISVMWRRRFSSFEFFFFPPSWFYDSFVVFCFGATPYRLPCRLLARATDGSFFFFFHSSYSFAQQQVIRRFSFSQLKRHPANYVLLRRCCLFIPFFCYFFFCPARGEGVRNCVSRTLLRNDRCSPLWSLGHAGNRLVVYVLL